MAEPVTTTPVPQPTPTPAPVIVPSPDPAPVVMPPVAAATPPPTTTEPQPTATPPAPAQPPVEPSTPAPPEEVKAKAEREAKEWLKMAYPEELFKEDKPKPEALKLETPTSPPSPSIPAAPSVPPPAPTAPTAPAATVPPPPDPLKVTKRKPVEVEEIVKQTVAATVAATTPKPPTPPATPPTPEPAREPEIDLTNWDADEIKLLRTYQYAEQENPEKYKGLVKGLQADKAKIEDYRAKAIAEDPEWNESEDSKFQSIAASIKPRLTAREVAELDEARIVSEAERRVAARHETKFKELEKVQRELQMKPVIEQTVTSFATNMAKRMAEKREGKPETVAAIATRFNEVGDAILQENRLTAPIVVDTLKRATALATEFTRLEQGLDEIDMKNPRHAWLVGFMRNYDGLASQQPVEKRTRVVEGVQQTFLPRVEYNRIARENPEQLDRYFTHSTMDYLAALGVQAEREASQKIAEFEQLLTKDGYRREPPKPAGESKPASPTPSPTEMRPTIPTSAPAPGPGVAASIKSGTPFMDDETLKLLKYK